MKVEREKVKKKKGTERKKSYGDWPRRRFFVGGAAMASGGTAGGSEIAGRRSLLSVPPLRST